MDALSKSLTLLELQEYKTFGRAEGINTQYLDLLCDYLQGQGIEVVKVEQSTREIGESLTGDNKNNMRKEKENNDKI